MRSKGKKTSLKIKDNLNWLVSKKIGVFYNLTRTVIRRLPQKGKITVKEGDVTESSAIIGLCHVSPGFRVFNLSEILNIPPEKIPSCLLKSSGSKVFKGDVIAEDKKLFGIISRQFIAPADGVFEVMDQSKGQMMIRFMPVSFKLPAGVYGEVVKVVPDQEVHIRTKVDLIRGVLGSGVEREGILKVVTSNKETISIIGLDKSLSGSIIAGGSMMTKEVIQKSLALGVRGILSGGINIHDYKSLVSSLNPLEDVGLSLLATEGYGSSEMPGEIFELLRKNDNCFAIISPQEKELIIPSLKSFTKTAIKEKREKNELCYLEKGMVVRLLTFPYLGREGMVLELSKSPTTFPSGIEAFSALIEIGKGMQVLIPIRNLEVVVNYRQTHLKADISMSSLRN